MKEDIIIAVLFAVLILLYALGNKLMRDDYEADFPKEESKDDEKT